ncbi:hypothetical protein C8034_v002425 [Colletotrichum sidae]|uniref:Uncharacterized protein n=1 Tax=Colletotrichum sidae TaxID=1347389 RepID=A0A4R8TBP7_9PEZI|nr:hypothetical protein C8034_v002425 [Colletotrichum sidae]
MAGLPIFQISGLPVRSRLTSLRVPSILLSLSEAKLHAILSASADTTRQRQRQRPQRPSPPLGGHESRWGAR